MYSKYHFLFVYPLQRYKVYELLKSFREMSFYTTGTTQSSSYTCPLTLSLCLGTYTTCSCNPSSTSTMSIWDFSFGVTMCAERIKKTIRLNRTEDGCATTYQQNGAFFVAWSEPKNITCTKDETSLCETSVLLIHAHDSLNGTTFECFDDNNNSYGKTIITIICKLHLPLVRY